MMIFPYLLLLTVFFLLLEIGFFIQSTHAYFSDFTFVANQLHLPVTILPGVIFFVLVQLAIHLFYCILVWYATCAVISWRNIEPNKQLQWGIGIWLLGLLTILTANQCFFPNSKFAELFSIFLINRTMVKVVLMLLLTLMAAVGAIMCRYLFMRHRKYVIVSALLLMGWCVFLRHQSVGQTGATHARPNVIIVGIDSLRPDYLTFFGSEKTQTPFLDQLLVASTVFGEAVTPLARTFPSWTSILTGQYPSQVNVRSNLAEQEKANLTQALPAQLQKHGYYTIYATDETRFSNMSQQFGFNEIVTPPIGLNDFLVGTFNDFPLSNLLVNTKIGKWLFPYSYGNRPVYFTYEPDSFLSLLQPTLEAQYKQPVFLAVHFCLPHSPYMWSDLQGEGLTPQQRYEKSISRVDEQIRDFFTLLKQNHFLEHAIVVVLSDHGEALELNGDRLTEKSLYVGNPKKIPKFYPPSLENEDWNQSAGHGTDVLGLTQYHTLLAFQLRGAGDVQTIGTIPGVVSLTEIKPTILQLLGLIKKDGHERSLVPNIQGQPFTALKSKHIFLESDYSPEAIRTVYPKTKEVLLEGIHLFQIDPVTTRLTVKPSMEQMIIESKQYADIYGKWMLALYPQDQHHQIPILVNLETGEWTNDLYSSFAKASPASAMLEALRRFYGQEVKL